jgi:hypothetical protein
MKKRQNLAAMFVLFMGFFFPTVGFGEQCIKLRGECYTNSLNDMETMGSAHLQGNKGLNLRCGVQGMLQGVAEDGSYIFKHTVVCADHSVFILDTRTVIQVEEDCQAVGLPGIIGSFEESSTMVGVDGPYNNWKGTALISGSIACGWNHMTIKADICGP